MRDGRLHTLLAALAFLLPATAGAEEMVVAAARGIELTPGQKIDSTKPLKLLEGQHVTLISVRGVTLKLDGPYDKPPSEATGGGVVAGALAALVTQQGARTIEAGVTRTGSTVAVLPDGWLLDASRSGTVCLRTGYPAILWRPASAREGRLSIMPADRSWKAEALWPSGSSTLVVSDTLPIANDSVFFVSLDNGDEAALTVSTVPADVAGIPMQSAWLAEQGCESQAEALLRSSR